MAPPNWLPHRPSPAAANPAAAGLANAAARPEQPLPSNTVLPGTGATGQQAGVEAERPAAPNPSFQTPVREAQRTPVALPPELSPRRVAGARPTPPTAPVSPADDIMAPTEARAGGRRGRAAAGPRRARLVLRRIDPWSVLKFTLVFSICGVIVGVLVIFALFEIVSGLGVFDSVAKFLDTITDAQAGSSTRSDFQAHVIVGGGAVLLAVGALLFTALATLGAFIYNLCASLTGGLEVTLSERS